MGDVQICAKCQGPAKTACNGCHLVLYCGKHCQKEHWPAHRDVCKSSLAKATWQPHWVTDGSTPAFVGDGPRTVVFGAKKYLWGNVPAIDILRLENNEGEGWASDLSLLFAASGDLRNVMKTVASAPGQFSKAMCVVINDMDLDIVARNIILLLIATMHKDETQAVDCMLHIWYSALVRQEHADFLTNRILPLIEEVNVKIEAKAPGTPLRKSWTFGSRTIRITLPKEKWRSLLAYFKTPHNLTAERSKQIRTAVTLAPERRDYRERHILQQLPEHRLSSAKFREDGMLLPFGSSREPFNVPNPTMFQTAEWPMMDSADPLDGWPLSDVLSTNIGPAANDVLGKLFVHVRGLLTDFRRRLLSMSCEIEMFNVNATDLTDQLKGKSFARIECSNICDVFYLGPARTVAHLAPLLQNPSENPHATLLMQFLNAVQEAHMRNQDLQTARAEMKRAFRYLCLRPPREGLSEYGSETIKLTSAVILVRDMDKLFDKYMVMQDFKYIANNYQVLEPSYALRLKDRNTVIDKWPLRLTREPGQPGAQEEFNLLLGSGHTGIERYVEWKKVPAA